MITLCSEGLVVFDGEGILDVRKVGIKTMMGKMAEDMQDEEPDSPLKVKVGIACKTDLYIWLCIGCRCDCYCCIWPIFIVNAGGFSGLRRYWLEQHFVQDSVEAVSLAIVD